MEPALREEILSVLKGATDMTIATIRARMAIRKRPRSAT